jgi:hypothetical protein
MEKKKWRRRNRDGQEEKHKVPKSGGLGTQYEYTFSNFGWQGKFRYRLFMFPPSLSMV